MSPPFKKRNLVTPPTTSQKDTAMASSGSSGKSARQVQVHVALAHRAYKQTISDARKGLLRAVSDTSAKDRALAMQLDAGFATFIHDIAVAKRRKGHAIKVPTVARHPGAPTTPGAQRLVSEFSSYRDFLKSAKKDLKSALNASAATSADVRQGTKKDLKSALVAPDSQSDADEDENLCSALHFLDAIPHKRKSSDASICTTDPDFINNTSVPTRPNPVDTAASPPGVPQLNSFATTMVSVPEEVRVQPCNTDLLCLENHDHDAHYGNKLLAQLIATESASLHHPSSTEVSELSGNITNVAYKIVSEVKNQGGRFLQKSVDGSWSIASNSATITMISRAILFSIIHAEKFGIDALTKQNAMLKEAAQENKKLHEDLEEITVLKQKLSAEKVLSRKRANRQSEVEKHVATLEQQLSANKALVNEQAKHIGEQKALIDTLQRKLNHERSINRDHANFESGQNGRIQFLQGEVDFYRNAYSWEYCCNEQSRREKDERAYRYWQSVGAPAQGAAGTLVCRLGSKEQAK